MLAITASQPMNKPTTLKYLPRRIYRQEKLQKIVARKFHNSDNAMSVFYGLLAHYYGAIREMTSINTKRFSALFVGRYRYS